MPIVKHLLSFDGGEWSPLLDGRTDLAKYAGACRRLENFVVRPQGTLSKRPGMEYRGKVFSGATDGKLVEFEIKATNSIILVIGGGKMKFFKDGSPIQYSGSDLSLTVPWDDGTLSLLRWKQINDVMMFVHPDKAPRILTRTDDTTWDLSYFVPKKNQPFLPQNLDEKIRIKVDFETNSAASTWSATWSDTNGPYKEGKRVLRSGTLYRCEKEHTSSNSHKPEDSPTYVDTDEEEDRLYWSKAFVDESSTQGQEVTLTCNKSLWSNTEGKSHIGAYWEIVCKRGLWAFETRLPVDKTATGSTAVYSKVIAAQGKWTAQSFGNWSGKYHVQVSRDKGKSWSSVRAYQSSQSTPRNFTSEGELPDRALLRLKFEGFAQNGTSGQPYAILNVEEGFLRGVVKITDYTNSKSVKAVCITPVEKETSAIWAEGAWSEYQGFPRCIEFHQNRVVLAATTRSPHTIWGSAVDDYDSFYRGTDADKAWAHTVMIGQREPIAWLLSDRSLVIGASNAEFVMRGENDDKPITPEFGIVSRQSSNGSHTKGPGVIPADSAALFVQHSGRIVRELVYKFDSDRYEAGNLTLFADHLFKAKSIIDFAVQRYPFQVIWFVADGDLCSLTYERAQQVAAWSKHPTAGTVVSVACIRKGEEDEVWFVMNHGGGVFTVERFHPGGLTTPLDDGHWADSCMTLNSPYTLTGNHLLGKTVIGWCDGVPVPQATLASGFFAGLTEPVTFGRPYSAKVMPMVPEVALPNGSSRTREARIHSVVPSLYRSRGGKMGEDPDGATFDAINAGAAGSLFTGETDEKLFDGKHNTGADFCVVSAEPFPFTIRSLCLKMNYFGDAR